GAENQSSASPPSTIELFKDEISSITPTTLLTYFWEGSAEQCRLGEAKCDVWSFLKGIWSGSLYALGRFFGGGLANWIVLIGAYGLFWMVLKGQHDDYHKYLTARKPGGPQKEPPLGYASSHIVFFLFWYGLYATIIKYVILGILYAFGWFVAGAVYVLAVT